MHTFHIIRRKEKKREIEYLIDNCDRNSNLVKEKFEQRKSTENNEV